MRRAGLLLVLASCAVEQDTGRADFDAKAWDDGKAVVSRYTGRVKRYGKWRRAEVRDYLVREFLDPDELTKRESGIPVLKANRLVTFHTGSYPYRRMVSLFFERASGRLVKAVGTSQEGCGIVYQRWQPGRYLFDSYWEGEGRGERELKKPDGTFFADELFYAPIKDGASIEILPSLVRNRLGKGDAVAATVSRDGPTMRLDDGSEFVYDPQGFLLRWHIPEKEEFHRVSKRRFYYWDHTDPGDRLR